MSTYFDIVVKFTWKWCNFHILHACWIIFLLLYCISRILNSFSMQSLTDHLCSFEFSYFPFNLPYNRGCANSYLTCGSVAGFLSNFVVKMYFFLFYKNSPFIWLGMNCQRYLPGRYLGEHMLEWWMSQSADYIIGMIGCHAMNTFWFFSSQNH